MRSAFSGHALQFALAVVWVGSGATSWARAEELPVEIVFTEKSKVIETLRFRAYEVAAEDSAYPGITKSQKLVGFELKPEQNASAPEASASDPSGTEATHERAPERFVVELEGGAVSASKNELQIPRDLGSRFGAPSNGYSGYFRAYLSWLIAKHHSIRLLYAPLAVEGQVTPLAPLVFNGLSFLAGQATDVRYQFSNYRLTYIYQFDPVGNFVFRLGATAFIRDAEVRLRNRAAGLETAFANVGFVPLVYFGARYNVSHRLYADFEIDGSAAPGGQGRAFDGAFSVGYRLRPKWTISGGYRFIEGGANVPRTYNFAFLSHFFGRMAYSF